MKTFFYVFSSVYLISFILVVYAYKTDKHLKLIEKINKIDHLEEEVDTLKQKIKLLEGKN